jgi:uncharacterized protein
MPPQLRPRPGEAVRIVMTKWQDRPHWEFDGTYLGSDEHGDWVGFPTGTLNRRPGAEFVSEHDAVSLVPPPDGEPVAHLATFYGALNWCSVYVDIATPGRWDGTVLRSVDLDLDVIRGNTGRVWVDDEDEFAQHRVQLGYPDELVRSAVASCERVHAAVRERRAPYDGAADAWLARVAGLRAT